MTEKKWTIDKQHSAMEFSVRHMMISSVKGKFDDFDGVIEGDVDNPSTMQATVRVRSNSINTGDNDRDSHLKSDDLFAGNDYPEIMFKSKKTNLNGEELEILGDITIRGVTKEISLKGEFGGKVKDPYGNERFGLTATGTLNRQDFGVKWNMLLEGGGVMVGDRVNLQVSLEAFAPME